MSNPSDGEERPAGPATGSSGEGEERPVASADLIQPRPASRVWVARILLIFAVAVIATGLGAYLSIRGLYSDLDHRSAGRDAQRQVDIARVNEALAKADLALAQTDANTAALKAAACFIAEPPHPPPGQTPEQIARTNAFRQRVGCTPNPTDQK